MDVTSEINHPRNTIKLVGIKISIFIFKIEKCKQAAAEEKQKGKQTNV